MQLDVLQFGGAAVSASRDVWTVGIDQVLQRQADVDPFLDRVLAMTVDVLAHANGVVGHLIQHLPVCVLEPGVVLEEVDVAEDMGHHQLLVDHHVVVQQVGVAGGRVDDHLVDLLQTVLVALLHLEVLHAPAPMGVPRGEPAVAGQHVDLVVVADLEDGLEEVQSVAPSQGLDAYPGVLQFGGEATSGAEEEAVGH